MFQSLRTIFKSFRSEEDERKYSRRAFYNFVGFLASCVLFSFIAQRKETLRLTQSLKGMA